MTKLSYVSTEFGGFKKDSPIAFQIAPECSAVAYNYCAMQWGTKYAGYSAPASVAFLYAIPYGIGIVVCVIVAIVLRKKGK